MNFSCDIDQHSVTQFHRVKKSQERDGAVVAARKEFKNAFASHGCVRVLAQGSEWVAFDTPVADDLAERINIPGGKRDDRNASVALGHAGGHDRIHGPGSAWIV